MSLRFTSCHLANRGNFCAGWLLIRGRKFSHSFPQKLQISRDKMSEKSNFKAVASAIISDFITVHKYKSEKTGLTVVLADVEGPVVTGHFAVATEAHDDDGLPHTLEHLIFLGSQKYPYKGVLDLLANRCLASGTNAWTDTDHTCYTMTTAGSDGFLNLLPIYLDHVLYPTLTDSGFLTEVHHITGEGEDGGVVYCEMQGRENTGESRANLNLLRAAYPESGYSAETGGILKNLRTSTNNEKVRRYHKTFYRPENLSIIVSGKVQPEKIFEALKPIEEKILAQAEQEQFIRPWQTAVPPLEESKDIKVLYPSDEEDCGLVYVGYRGPNSVKDYLSITGCNLLLRYLTDTPVSPLQREFVEIEDPFASRVSHGLIENRESLLYLIFENVPIPKLDRVYCKLQVILKRFAQGVERIDMKRMHSIIEREMLESLSNLETNPHEVVAFLIIGDFVYGESQEHFKERLNVKKQLQHFLTVAEDYWVNLLKKYLVDGNYVCVRAFPSIAEQARMSKEELQRIEQQRNNLGPEGLIKKAEELKEAMEQNEEQPPESMLTIVPVPSVKGIHFHHVNIYKSIEPENIVGWVKKVINFDDFPTYAEVYDIRTNFIYMTVTMNTDALERRLRPYLLLFLELILESPVRRGEDLIPYEEVVAALERDTIATGTGLGLEANSSFSCGPFSHTALIMLQVDPSKYKTGVTWVKDLLCSSVFLAERVKVVASKMLNTVSQAKRRGNSVVRDLLKAMYYEKGSNVRVCSMLKQQKFLSTLLENLDDLKKSQNVLSDLNKVRESLTDSRNVAIHLAANLSKTLEERRNLSEPWADFVKPLPQESAEKYGLYVVPDWKIIRPEGVNALFQGTVVGLGAVESAFLFHTAPSIRDFMDPDLPALMLYIQYLTQLEGPLWRQIRGQGFAYGYNIVPRPHEGLLCLTLYRATNVVAAFKETKTIIENQLAESNWDENLLESARSSLIFEIIERERSIGHLVMHSLLCSFKQVPADYNKTLVQQVNEVTTSQLDEVGKKYVAKLFAVEAKTAIVCHPDKVKEITSGFSSLGRELTAVMSLEESILAK